MGESPIKTHIYHKLILSLIIVLFTVGQSGFPSAIPVEASPIAPELSILVTPTTLDPAEGGFIHISGAYPLVVSITLDDQSLDVYHARGEYIGFFSFPFDAAAGEHYLHIQAINPVTGQTLDEIRTIIVTDFRYPLEQVSLPAILTPLLALDINENELTRLDTIYTRRSRLSSWNWPFILPVEGGVVTSRFGGDRIYNGGVWAAHHTGSDFRRAIGEPIIATADGRVVAADYFDIRGNVIIIDHGFGVFSQYAHQSKFLVGVGDLVRQGQEIGLAGGGGRSNGPHLHFEIVVNGIPVDPIAWLALNPDFVPPREFIPTVDDNDEVPPDGGTDPEPSPGPSDG